MTETLTKDEIEAMTLGDCARMLSYYFLGFEMENYENYLEIEAPGWQEKTEEADLAVAKACIRYFNTELWHS